MEATELLGDDIPSSDLRGHRLRRSVPQGRLYTGVLCFLGSGGIFIFPEFRGQAVTQGGNHVMVCWQS